MKDSRGLAVTAASADAARRFDETVAAYCALRRDTGDHLKRTFAADPDMVMAHILKGDFMLLFATHDTVGRAKRALADAKARMAGATRHEALHLKALERWTEGSLSGATTIWRAIGDEFPRDILAMRLAQYGAFYAGDAAAMRAATAPAALWDEGDPGYGFALGCHAFSLEECGEYDAAERAGRRAVTLEPHDIWAAHAVAHVFEMRDRTKNGLGWIAALERNWADTNNFAFHVFWHRCLFLLEEGRGDEALALYDREVRADSTDEYLDISNAVSLLWRFEEHGLAVGERWAELATRSRAHIDDHCLVFADLHYLMALAAAGDEDGVARWLASARAHAATSDDDAAHILNVTGTAIAQGILAHRKGAWSDAVAALLPVRAKVRLIGGSHAQRDLFEMMLIDAARRSNAEQARALIDERLARRPGNRWAADALKRL